MPDLEIVPGLGIVTSGAARSVLLVAKDDPRRLRTVALDPESRTSNALTRVLFAERFRHWPAFVGGERELAATLARCDGAVRIGDKALFETPPPGTQVHDLGEAWAESTGLPFVFAAWIARPGVVDRGIYRALHESRRRGVRAIQRIADDYTWNGRRDPPLALRYLTENIRFRLGAAELRGLAAFFRLAAAHGVIDRAPELRFALARVTDCHRAAGVALPVAERPDEVPRA
jgi:chorismate dehydratase